jgi:hypothetical protein
MVRERKGQMVPADFPDDLTAPAAAQKPRDTSEDRKVMNSHPSGSVETAR